jgi:DNA-binding NtrC family response regulator
VLESGEFIKVGSSKVLKTNVRVVAASNVNIPDAVSKGRFREDLYYRLNTVPIFVPPLRERREDIPLLFRKFAGDFAGKHRIPPVKLDTEAENLLQDYSWQGNVRQLKNITEQISIIEKSRDIHAGTLQKYLPETQITKHPTLYKGEGGEFSERELLYKVLFDMRKDVSDLKRIVFGMLQGRTDFHPETVGDLSEETNMVSDKPVVLHQKSPVHNEENIQEHEEVEEPLSLEDKEIEMIKKALSKYRGRRNKAAKELGISERTLYRKITRYGIEE